MSVLPAQAQRLAVLRAAGEPPAGTVAWFVHGFETVEAHLDVDVRMAMAEATRLWQAAQGEAPTGAAAAAAAVVAFVCGRLEGPTAAAPWIDRAAVLPKDTGDALLAYHHLARARCDCQLGEHGRELHWAIPGQACAERVGDPVLKMRLSLATLHATPQRGLASLVRAFASAEQAGHGASVAFLRPWLLAEQHNERHAAGRVEERDALLAQLVEQAERLGSVRLQGLIANGRGHAAASRQDFDSAILHFEQACELFDRLGDLVEGTAVRDLLGWCETRCGDLAAAERWLGEAEQRIAGRGLASIEQELLRTRLELAVRRRDGDAAAALADELERRAAGLRETERGIAVVRASLQQSEELRLAAEARARSEQEQSARQTLQGRLYMAFVAFLGLAVSTAVVWRSRRRLQRANAALAEQVRRVEAAQAVQATLEARLRQLERAEGVSTLAAGIAHDFNNLLTAVLGNAQLLRGELRSAAGEELVDAVVAATRQAARLCKQLQTYAGGEPAHREPVELVGLMTQLLPVLRASSRCRVEWNVQADARSTAVRIDRVQCEQVLLNLVVNAQDAGASVVHIGMRLGADGRDVAIEVQDDGEGMTPEIAQRIFDPFFTTRFPGRGLGLAVVHGVVHRHGGTIEVASDKGRGTTFTIRWPAAGVTPPRPEPTVVLPTLPAARAAALLVVDDDPAVLRVLGQTLQQPGHRVTTSADGPGLLAALAAVPPGLPVVVFADLAMPGMDGLEVLRLVAARRPEAHRVLISGHPVAYLERAAAAAGVANVLSKPVQREELLAMVAILLATTIDEAIAAP